jgi:hypothetical protein
MALQRDVAVTPDERREFPRFTHDPLVPVLFGNPSMEIPTAGLVHDVSVGGVRIVAPPTARPYLHWADPILVQVSYSESTRSAGIEGLKLRAYVVRLVVDASGFSLQARFDVGGHDGQWAEFCKWVATLNGPRP